MGRYSGIRSSGTLAAMGSGQRSNFYSTIILALQTYQSAGRAAWETWYIGSSTNITFRSIGDRTSHPNGDTSIFVTLALSGSFINLLTYSDFSQVAGGNSRVTPVTATLTNIGIGSDTEQLKYWFWGNAYEFSCIYYQASVGYRIFSGGQLLRSHIPAGYNGTCFSSAPISSGSNVIVYTDRDMTGQLTVGQKVWLINQTPAGSVIVTNTVEVCTLAAIQPTYITLSSVANAYGKGALIGLDPQNNYVTASSGSNASPGTYHPYLYMVHRNDGSYNSGLNRLSMVSDALYDNFPPRNTLDDYGMFWGGRFTPLQLDGQASVRGLMEHLKVIQWVNGTPGAPLAEAIIYNNLDPNDAWIHQTTQYMGSATNRYNWLLKYA